MRVVVTFRHVEPTAGLRQYAEEKVQRISKFVRRPIEAHVTLSVEKQRHIAEIQLVANHLNTTATEETTDLYAAIDLATSKLERQVKKRAAKVKDRKVASVGGEKTEASEERAGARIRTQRVAIKPMALDEAVLQLQLLKQDFLLFRNAANELLSVLRRREDGEFDLLEPEAS